jgi:hypothetical protein
MKGFNCTKIRPSLSVDDEKTLSEPWKTLYSRFLMPSSPPFKRTLPFSSSNIRMQIGTNGAGVGGTLGDVVGATVGVRDGDGDGDIVGDCVGAFVGASVGAVGAGDGE